MRHGRLYWGGFTLIDLVIAMAIVALLAAIALPIYLDYLRSSRRVDGQSALLALQQGEENWRSNHPSYTENVSDLGLGSSSSGGYYTIAIDSGSATATEFSATATATGSQVGDASCSPLTLARSVSGGAAEIVTGPAGCWKK